MASLIVARRLSSKFSKKISLYSATSPLSYLNNHPINDHSFNNSNNSFSSIFNENYYKSTNTSFNYSIKKKTWASCDKVRNISTSSEEQDKDKIKNNLVVLTTKYDELSSEYKKILDEIRGDKKEFPWIHQEFFEQLPQELNEITPDKFRKLTEIVLRSMTTMKDHYTAFLLFHPYIISWQSRSNPVRPLLFGMKAMLLLFAMLHEIESVDKVKSLVKMLEEEANINNNNNSEQIQTLFLQVLKQVKTSCDNKDNLMLFYFGMDALVLVILIICVIFFK